MIGAWVAPVKTPATPEEASLAYRSALLLTLGGRPKPITVAVLHAHGALETGRFASMYNNNAGNIKAGERWEGLYTTIKLNEVLVRHGVRKTIWFDPRGELDGKDGPIVKGTEFMIPPGHPQTRMRAHTTLAGGIGAKLHFLSAPEWRNALDFALRGDPGGYVRAIHAKGYFTADPGPYERAVVSLTATYLPLAEGNASDTDAEIEANTQLCVDMAACQRFELPDWLRARLRVQQAQHVDFALDVARADRDREIAELDSEPTQPETPEAKS